MHESMCVREVWGKDGGHTKEVGGENELKKKGSCHGDEEGGEMR